jgi:hypothetical protein
LQSGHLMSRTLTYNGTVITETVTNNDPLTPRRDRYFGAVGDRLRCHIPPDHLLHDQPNYADNILDPVYQPYYG